MQTGDGNLSTPGSRSTVPWVCWGGGCGGRTYCSASTGHFPQFALALVLQPKEKKWHSFLAMPSWALVNLPPVGKLIWLAV